VTYCEIGGVTVDSASTGHLVRYRLRVAQSDGPPAVTAPSGQMGNAVEEVAKLQPWVETLGRTGNFCWDVESVDPSYSTVKLDGDSCQAAIALGWGLSLGRDWLAPLLGSVVFTGTLPEPGDGNAEVGKVKALKEKLAAYCHEGHDFRIMVAPRQIELERCAQAGLKCRLLPVSTLWDAREELRRIFARALLMSYVKYKWWTAPAFAAGHPLLAGLWSLIAVILWCLLPGYQFFGVLAGVAAGDRLGSTHGPVR